MNNYSCYYNTIIHFLILYKSDIKSDVPIWVYQNLYYFSSNFIFLLLYKFLINYYYIYKT